MGAAEEFFHVFWIGAWRAVFDRAVIEFDGANRPEGSFIAKNKVDNFIIDETISFFAILTADAVIKQGFEADARDNVEFLAKNVV